MDFWNQTNWYAVQAKPCRENLAAASVTELGVAVFLPRIEQEQPIGGVWRHVVKPLFPGYFFAHFCPLISLNVVRSAFGVLRVVAGRRFPIPLEDDVIAAIQDRVQVDGFVRLKTRPFQPGDNVTIEKGPLAGWMGEVERELDCGRRVALFLNVLQQARVVIEKRWLTHAAAEV